MIQKIIKVGNSAAVTIPQEFLKKRGWRIGEKVDVDSDVEMGAMVIRDRESTYSSTITPEFKEWLASFTKRNRQLLEELSK